MAIFQAEEHRLYEASLNHLLKPSLHYLVGGSTLDLWRLQCVVHEDFQVAEEDEILRPIIEDTVFTFAFQLPSPYRFVDGLPPLWKPDASSLMRAGPRD